MKVLAFLSKATFGTALGEIASLSVSPSAKAETLTSFCGLWIQSRFRTANACTRELSFLLGRRYR